MQPQIELFSADQTAFSSPPKKKRKHTGNILSLVVERDGFGEREATSLFARHNLAPRRDRHL